MKGDFSPQFALRLALKDVRLALDAAGDDQFPRSVAWPTSGSKPSRLDSATRTSRS